MPRPDTESFNKEKFVFLLVSAGFAGGLYLFLASAPVPLDPDKPISSQALPQALENVAEAAPRPEQEYVEGPGRDRKTPFAPAATFIAAKPVDNPGNKPPPPPPPPPSDTKPKDTKPTFDAKDLDVQVSFMGVVMMNGNTYALLRPKDGSSPRRVKVGDTISDFKYTVTKIEKQAIWMVDEEQRPFILKDNDEVALADSSSSKPEKPAPKHEPKPAPKPAPHVTLPTPVPQPLTPPDQPRQPERNPRERQDHHRQRTPKGEQPRVGF
jgi:hypothetical protein